MRNLTQTLSLVGMMCIGATAVHAAVPTTVSTTPGSGFSVAALETSATSGATMDGMIVSVTFADATTSTGIWAATGIVAGHAFADGWSLSVNGSTFDDAWRLTNSGTRGTIVGFSIDAAPASVSFDVIASPDLTPESGPGGAFGSLFDSLGTVTAADAVYSNRLFVGGSFHGDMYEMLTVSLTGGVVADGVLQFMADTDHAPSGSITQTIPEPETYALMLAGLGLVAFVARRRRA